MINKLLQPCFLLKDVKVKNLNVKLNIEVGFYVILKQVKDDNVTLEW